MFYDQFARRVGRPPPSSSLNVHRTAFIRVFRMLSVEIYGGSEGRYRVYGAGRVETGGSRAATGRILT